MTKSNARLGVTTICLGRMIHRHQEPKIIMQISLGLRLRNMNIEDKAGLRCDTPPTGWICTRAYGHEGSCAALAVPILPKRLGWRTAKVCGRPWQDLLFSIGEIVFLLTLVPLWLSDAKVPTFTGIGTGFMLYCFMMAHISYRNWITVVLSFITATLWVLIGLGVSP